MSFQVHSKETAPAASVPILEGLEQHMGFIPNLIGVMAESPIALTSVAAVNQAIENSSLSPIERRVVTVTASAENNCVYCVPAQSTLAKLSDMPDEILDQIRSRKPLADKRLEALHAFTLNVIRNNGWVPETDVNKFLKAGFQISQVLEVITMVSLMTLTNYVSHISSVPLDEAFMAQRWNEDQHRPA
jgi:uncharacterized peroxidase-related enzyme